MHRKAGRRRGGVFNLYNLSALYFMSCLGIVLLRFPVASCFLCRFSFSSRGEGRSNKRGVVDMYSTSLEPARLVGECNGQVMVLGQHVV